MQQAIINFLAFLPDWLEIIVISAIPVVELRGAIPLAILAYDMSYLQAYLLGVLGSIIPAPFILMFIPAILKWMSGTKIFGKMASWIIAKGMKKSDKLTQYEFWGLFIFVAIPLPGTGVWTGCLAASLIGLDFKHSMISVALGSATAGIIVTALVAGGLSLF
ncbi:small multi-drug export protein [Acetobacterium wieringae]|uniref:Small multi-drug export protein n=1 Tax=Acetobacterium wieringae TaxID=52694 RepID=A0A5D0WH84_9FIRM|nr:small multi-drug export protein [Acetobacterium wieringae]TYC82308.1 small multi-drug export protein [Acetobacterium wieringae]